LASERASSQPVDEAGRPGLLGDERTGVGEPSRLVGREASGPHHARSDLFELRVEDALELLALGLGERCTEQLAGGALVLVASLEDRVDADAVEGAPDEVHLSGEPHEADLSRGLQHDLVARGGEVVGAVAATELAERVAEGHRPLARLSQGRDGVAQLLDLRHPAAIERGVHDDPCDAPVAGRPLEELHGLAHRELPAPPGLGQQARADRLRGQRGHIELEHGARRKPRTQRPGYHRQDQRPDHHDGGDLDERVDMVGEPVGRDTHAQDQAEDDGQGRHAQEQLPPAGQP
jgi:hypothetical protein